LQVSDCQFNVAIALYGKLYAVVAEVSLTPNGSDNRSP